MTVQKDSGEWREIKEFIEGKMTDAQTRAMTPRLSERDADTQRGKYAALRELIEFVEPGTTTTPPIIIEGEGGYGFQDPPGI